MAFAASNFNVDTAAESAEAFMSDWGSDIFRGLCVDRIEEARQQSSTGVSSDDPVVHFLTQKSSQELEDFVFKKSNSREDYLGYVMEMVQMMKEHGGCQHKPAQPKVFSSERVPQPEDVTPEVTSKPEDDSSEVAQNGSVDQDQSDDDKN